MSQERLLKSYTIRTYGNMSALTRITLGRHIGMGSYPEVYRVKKQTVFFFNLLFNVFQMLDELFDFLGNSEN